MEQALQVRKINVEEWQRSNCDASALHKLRRYMRPKGSKFFKLTVCQFGFG